MAGKSLSDKLASVPILGGVFFEQQPQGTPPAPPPATPPPAPPPIGSATIAVNPSGPDVQKYYDGLDRLMQPVASAGFTAFLTQLGVLGNIIKDNDTTLIPAAAAAAGGVGQQEILHEISDCLDVVGQQRGVFNNTMQKRVAEDLGAKQSEIEQTKQQIAGLESQIASLRQRLEALSGDVGATQRRAEAERQSFEAAATRHEQRLNQLRERVQRHLSAEGGPK